MVGPGHAHIRRAAHVRHVLEMLRKHEWAGLENQDAPAARRIRNEEMFGDDRPECPAADDDDIEVARSSSDGFACAIAGFRQRVAQEASHVIQRERGGFRRQ